MVAQKKAVRGEQGSWAWPCRRLPGWPSGPRRGALLRAGPCTLSQSTQSLGSGPLSSGWFWTAQHPEA